MLDRSSGGGDGVGGVGRGKNVANRNSGSTDLWIHLLPSLNAASNIRG